jgi:2-C-methyl-D-erythritol 4-phosphate cytidylyltransferase / 2-C-methyl-D-erythritol 2,4-cyclodiphosphate synthase
MQPETKEKQNNNNALKKERTIALLVAAGSSERMGAPIPKPYLQLGEETVLRRTVKAFMTHPGIDGVRVVISRSHHPYYRNIIQGLTVFPPVMGGDCRQSSVRLGLESLAHRAPERVLVHDIARPMVSHELISRVLDALDEHPGVIPALPVTDTLKRVMDGTVSETVEREGLFHAQTPQGFHFAPLLDAHQRFAHHSLTDDAAIFEAAKLPVMLVEGDTTNQKLTTKADMERMEMMLSLSMDTRTGIGYDVHTLAAHDADTPVAQQNIKLCGVRIPFTHYLVGHSDADVGLHAMVDAILGAIGEGDIGTHFPPDDRKWQGADSERFLLHAYELLKQHGGELVNIDTTLICERPKIGPHRQAMIDHIAQTLKIDPKRISIKATTTERLGFTGRGEGIAAQAVATVRLPR